MQFFSDLTSNQSSQKLMTYAILDDGSEQTILLHSEAEKLGIKGQPEDLSLRTVKHVLKVERI